jgi:TolB-like protein/Tfp pilus assembly protein PilF
MSPEQVRGERVDARTDLWSLGVMLHEMCTGRRPFEGRDHATLLYQIAHTPAPSAAKLRPELSDELLGILARLLEKDPTRRYPDAAATSEALRGLGPTRDADGPVQDGARRNETTMAAMSPAASGVAPAPASPTAHPVFRSLAVLPLANRSGDPSQEFFADGMTDALITDLAQISALRVISRTSAMRFKASELPLPDIARELRVDVIVEGSVLLVGGRVRLTAQLIEAATDRSLWAQSYERELTDILTLQRELARTIADEVRVRVTPEESERLRPKGPVNPVAHVAYLRGRSLWSRWTTPALRESLGHYEEALAADPRYALAYAGLADSYATLGNTNAMPPADAYARARDAAERGLAIDPSLAELHASLAYVHRFHDWDWPAAERSFQRALSLNPGYATGRRWYAQFLAGLARHNEAIAEAERALELDPLSLIIHTALGDCLFYARRYELSVAYYRRCLELDPTFGPGHTDLARSLEHLGRPDEALAEFLIGTGQSSAGPYQPSTGLATLLVRAGRREEGLAMARELAARAAERHVSAYGIASVYAVAGENAQALDWLERAHAERDGTLVWIKVHPRMDGLRAEPRFRELLSKMRLDQ